jgi:DNA-binding MarR family transcriptional regulator
MHDGGPVSEPGDVAARLHDPGAAFLLSALGFQSSRRWSARLEPIGLDARQVMALRVIGGEGSMTQAALARRIGVPASRIVGLVDELEAAGQVERRPGQSDRRVHMLNVTEAGAATLRQVVEISIAHEAEMLDGLSPDERRELLGLLRRIAEAQGLTPGIHPGAAVDRPFRGG